MVTLVLLALAIGCSGPTSPSGPPPTAGLSVTCPQPVTVAALQVPAAVQYDTPQASGGTAPVAVTCTLPSGADFPAGLTKVVCSATDALQQTAACEIPVTVSLAARLDVTTFLAIGDSITEGQVSLPPSMPLALEPHNSYPAVLQEMLRAVYPLQADGIEVVNAGVGGMRATDDEDRIYQEIDARRPEVLLLLHGANDVNANLSPDDIAASLRADINRAFRLGVRAVFVSTLLPQVEGRSHAIHPELVEPLNDLIRAAAEREGATLVDAYGAFDATRELLIGVDGLHPTREGYRVLAQLFMDAIENRFRVLPPAEPAPETARRPLHRPLR